MASSVIHLAVAKEINKKLLYEERSFLLGSIVPDIWKTMNVKKKQTHFLDTEENPVPNIDSFLKKYKEDLNDPFVAGYFVHLYTDYLWFKYFITEIIGDKKILLLSGDMIDRNINYGEIIYSDYDSITLGIIDKFELDLDLLSNEHLFDNLNIKEINNNKIKEFLDMVSLHIINTKEKEQIIFNNSNIETFIKRCDEIITEMLINKRY